MPASQKDRRASLRTVRSGRPVKPAQPEHETRMRILEAAEALFMLHGFEGTSLRMLTARAGVNLAAVNYHFGSKDALIEALFRRRLDPMNAERAAGLAQLEAGAGGEPLAPAEIIRAFIAPSLRMFEDARGGGRNFIRLLGRAYTDPSRGLRALMGTLYADAMARYRSAFRRALPALPREELNWRLYFMFGTLSYTLTATDTMQLIAGSKQADRYDARLIEQRLLAFLTAGLLAAEPGESRVRQAA
jgi:AcrR family transcriptional regulator